MSPKVLKKLTLMLALSLVALSAIANQPSNPDRSLSITTNDAKLAEAIATIITKRPAVEQFGVVLANIHDFAPELKLVAKRELGFSDRLQIVCIQRNSLADQLGLRPGDQLLQINDFYVSRGKTAFKMFAEKIVPSVDWNEPLDTTIIRDGFGQTRTNKGGCADS